MANRGSSLESPYSSSSSPPTPSYSVGADLSYVLLVTAIGYVLVAFLSYAFLGEQISAQRWIGTLVITAGVMLVGSTPVSTRVSTSEDDA